MGASDSRLVVRRGQFLEAEYPLSDRAVTIGREATNDIMVQELEISRRHATITFSNRRHLIEDLNSTNGTFVNGRRISTPVPLRDGDIIDLGDSVSLVYYGPTEADSATLVDPEADSTEAAEAREREQAGGGFALPSDVPQYSDRQPAPGYSSPAQISQPSQTPSDPSQMAPLPPVREKRDLRRVYIGCGCLALLLIFGCVAAFVFLDTYQGGELLYCRALRPVWETIFGLSRVAITCS